MKHFLDFEKPIAELEGKIEELRHLSDDDEINIAEEVSKRLHLDVVDERRPQLPDPQPRQRPERSAGLKAAFLRGFGSR